LPVLIGINLGFTGADGAGDLALTDRGRTVLHLDRAAPSRGLARLSSTIFRFAVSATVAYPAFDVAYDGLPTVIYMNMLDANVLLSPVTQPSKNLYLHRIRPH
jgi:hypothetical protein